MRVTWSARARRDLLSILRFIADDDPVAAERWIRKLRVRASGAARAPGTGRWLPERPDRKDLREVIFKGYRIVYTIQMGRFIVVTVFEGHKLLPAEI